MNRTGYIRQRDKNRKRMDELHAEFNKLFWNTCESKISDKDYLLNLTVKVERLDILETKIDKIMEALNIEKNS